MSKLNILFIQFIQISPINRISWNFVDDKNILCTSAYSQESLIWFFLWENFGRIKLFCTTFLKLVKHEWQRNCSIRYAFDSERRRCVIQMWPLWIDNVYPIIIDIPLWFSVRLPITNAWNCHSLWIAFCQTMLERGVCEFDRSFFHLFYTLEKKNRFSKKYINFTLFYPKIMSPWDRLGSWNVQFYVPFPNRCFIQKIGKVLKAQSHWPMKIKRMQKGQNKRPKFRGGRHPF